MTAADLHNTGSAIEAAVAMNPGKPISIDPLEVARMLMWAASQIERNAQ